MKVTVKIYDRGDKKVRAETYCGIDKIIEDTNYIRLIPKDIAALKSINYLRSRVVATIEEKEEVDEN